MADRPPVLLDLGRYPAGDSPEPTRIRDAEGRDTVGTTANAVVGIDVSKTTLDACLLTPDGKARDHTFPNDPAGHATLLAWADRHAPGADTHFGMEATGGYEDALAGHLTPPAARSAWSTRPASSPPG